MARVNLARRSAAGIGPDGVTTTLACAIREIIDLSLKSFFISGRNDRHFDR
jgi:hypothetical protein